MGRLLGLGPGGECLLHALAYGHRLPALGYDPAAAWHAKGLEHSANHSNLRSVYLWYLPHPQRRSLLSPYLRTVQYWSHVPVLPWYPPHTIRCSSTGEA